MSDLRTVSVAGVTMTLPEGQVARLLSRPGDTAVVEAFLDASPDTTIHHRRGWIEFSRGITGAADLMLIERDGAALFALPVNPEGRTLAMGYSGVLFPPGRSEATQKRAVRAFRALVDANPKLGFQGTQAAQAPAYDDADRTALLSWQIEQEGLAGPSLWCRMLEWGPADPVPAADDDPLEHLGGYDAKLRNQIRQAGRHGIELDYAVADDTTSAAAVYRDFTALHRDSWSRTGLHPHGLSYWLGMSAAVVASGGRDLVVLARSPDGELVASVICHLLGRRAIYWAGASRPSGLEARANPLCLHAAITRGRTLGVTSFELGRFSTTEPSEKERSITRYKAQFGGRVLPLTTVATPSDRAEWLAHQAYRARRKLRVWRGGEYQYA